MAQGVKVLAALGLFAARFERSGTEGGVAWNDPDLAIPWPVTEPEISPKDHKHPRLRDVPEGKLFTFSG